MPSRLTVSALCIAGMVIAGFLPHVFVVPLAGLAIGYYLLLGLVWLRSRGASQSPPEAPRSPVESLRLVRFRR